MKKLRFLFRDRSFAFKFTLLTTIPVIIVAVSIALISTRTLEQSITEATYVRVKRNTSLAALSISNPYVIYNKALLDLFVESLKQEKDILYAFVVDYNDGRITAHSDHSRDGSYYQYSGPAKIQITGTGTNGIARLPSTGFEAVSPVRIGGELVGSVRVGFTLDGVNKKITSLRLSIVIITFAAVIFGIFLSVFLSRVVSRPILSLASRAQKVAEGNFEQQFIYESRDVVGRLYEAFNKMSRDLRERLYLIETNEKKYRSLFEASNDAVLILDQGKIIDCNQESFKMFKCSVFKLLNGRIIDFSSAHHPGDTLSKTKFERKIEQAESGHRQRFYWKCARCENTQLDTEVSLSPTVILDKQMVLAVVQDITERKAAEAEIENFNRTLEKKVDDRTRDLQDAQEAMFKLVEDLNASKKDLEIQKIYLEQLFKASPEALVRVNEFHKVVKVNKYFSVIFGFSEEEIKGKSLDLFITPEFRREEWDNIKNDIAVGKSPYYETQRQRKDKSLVDVSITGMPIIIDGKEKGAYAIYRDISDRKKAEKELNEAQKAAEAANRAKGEFLANMSHEIRTPMNAIVGLAYLIKQTQLSPQQYDYLMKIESSAESLLNVINDILDFSKIEAGKLEMESVEFYLEDVLNRVGDMVAMKADEKGLELIFTIRDNTPDELVGDPLRLAQVLINLVTNAVKFTEKGEVVVEVKMLGDHTDETVLAFEIRDTGIGLSHKQKSKLFKAFSQADTSTTRRFGGTGLGLVICQRIVGMMGGQIELESELGKGSSFCFTVRLGRHGKKRHLPAMFAADFKNMNALVVDDSQTARYTLKRVLESLNLNVTLSSSGQEALGILGDNAGSDKRFDMVFMDYRMPMMDGMETARHIKENIHLVKMPILVMTTAYGREEVLLEAEEIGLDGFITKPVTASTVLDNIMTALGKTSNLQQKEKSGQLQVQKGLAGISGARILLAEDNEINQQVAYELLMSVGFEVSIAGNGQVALEMMGKDSFDAVLMDVQMPVMDGLTAAKKIRKLDSGQKNIPIIALTAHAMTGDREKSIQAGMNDHLTKPLDPEKLFMALTKWIAPGERGPVKINFHASPKSVGMPKSAGMNHERVMPKVPGIDLGSVLARVGGNPRTVTRLIKKFAAGHHGAVDEIEQFLESGEIHKAMESAHALKGVSGTIGALELHKNMVKLEKAIKEEENETWGCLIESSRSELKKVIDSIRKLDMIPGDKKMDAVSVKTPHPLDMEKITLALPEIKVLLESNSFSVGKKVDALSLLMEGSRVQKEFNMLKKRVESYRFKEALQALFTLSKAIKKLNEGN